MKHTRRHFSRLLPLGIAAMADLMSLAATPVAGVGVRRFSAAFFRPLAGSDFLLGGGSGRLTLRAVKASVKVSKRPRTPEVECVTLRFEGSGIVLPEGTYTLHHRDAGEMALHLIPADQGRYLAYFAHLPEEFLNNLSIPKPAQIQTAL